MLTILLVLASYSKFILKQKLIKVGDYSILVVLTGSMEPTIKAGEMILIKEKDQYQVGDIVTYIDEDAYFITHRITQINGNECITRGDNNNVDDQPINRKDIIGKVIHIGHEYGIYLKIIKTPTVFITFFISIILMDIALSEDKEVSKLEKEKKE